MWPEQSFGERTADAEQDLATLKEVFDVDLTETAQRFDEATKKAYSAAAAAGDEEDPASVSDEERNRAAEVKENEQGGEQDGVEGDEEEEGNFSIAQIPFNFTDYIMCFTKADIINW